MRSHWSGRDSIKSAAKRSDSGGCLGESERRAERRVSKVVRSGLGWAGLRASFKQVTWFSLVMRVYRPSRCGEAEQAPESTRAGRWKQLFWREKGW